MNNIIRNLIGETIQIEVSGKKMIHGTVIDSGNDMIVVFNRKDFVYIPLNHIQKFEINEEREEEIEPPMEFPEFIAQDINKNLSLSDVLTQAIGKFVEIFVTEGHSLHGKITNVMGNYFVFESPIYKTVYISKNHLKWLIPYLGNDTPYSINEKNLATMLNDIGMANSFEALIEKLKDRLVVFNISGRKSFIGQISNVEAQIVEIQTARKEPVFLNIAHIKSVHHV